MNIHLSQTPNLLKTHAAQLYDPASTKNYTYKNTNLKPFEKAEIRIRTPTVYIENCEHPNPTKISSWNNISLYQSRSNSLLVSSERIVTNLGFINSTKWVVVYENRVRGCKQRDILTNKCHRFSGWRLVGKVSMKQKRSD